MRGLIDLHCHVLPGLDDGPTDCDSAVELVRSLRALGFDHLHPTPHQFAGRWAPELTARERSAKQLRQALAAANCDTTIHPPGGENMWDELFLQRQESLDFPRYSGNASFLLEFPPGVLPPGLQERLFELRLAGLLPVIAHIERYPQLLQRPALLEGRAALLLNISTLGGIAGWSARRAARQLIRRGGVHALATDSHGPADLHFTERGLAWLEKEHGTQALTRLLIEGPRAILAGEIPEADWH